MAVQLFKPTLATLGVSALIVTCTYVSTEVGLRSEGWHEVTVEMPRNPGYGTVGQSLFTPDGSKVLVTAVTKENGKHLVHAKVEGTHRYALALFPTRWEHSFAMDTPSLEWTVRQASGQSSTLPSQSGGQRWHVLN
ncbi:hypothetical protein OKA04_12670 [Luteolibacter flavescens]|uniref:Uncharacterized protein n=1 Tax=Luteolibacter flavescens TaxID=1859460 RepID=A0ABT3FPT4_9BACT|nr:hypothetical protein [Luteolibacter flavescens]MCW1885585.1 hypothetical protein [Luteolibacter flavescens]